MKRTDIITLPHKSLRERSQRVRVVTDEIKQLAQDMADATLDWEDHRDHEFGVALAAVQVNKLVRLVVVRDNFRDKEDRGFTAFINPEIVKTEGEPEEDFEGCLSVLDLYGKVKRYPKVKVKALGLDGKEIRVTAEGFLARVFQHEIDHTNGLVFLDRLDDDAELYKLDADGKLKEIEGDADKASLLR